MFKSFTLYLASVRSEFLAGISAHKELAISQLTIIPLIYGIFWAVNSTTTFLSCELTIFINVIYSTKSKRSLYSWFIRFIWCRLMTLMFFYTIYSNLDDDQYLFYLTYAGLLLSFPLLLSWYIFDPFLLSSKKSSDERFDFFLSRYPFYTGYGSILALLIFSHGLMCYYDYESRLMCTIIHSCIALICGKRRETAPLYVQYLPYTPTQYVYSPADAIDNFINAL